MKTRPVIEDQPKYGRQHSYETPTGPKIVELVCDLVVHWDERTQITVRTSERENTAYDQETRFRLLASRCGRIAEIIANAPAMVDELWEKDQLVEGGSK